MVEATQKVIQRLKEVKVQKNLTCQDIVTLCEAQNEAVSLSSVRRIFAKDSEFGPDFRQYTLNAVFRAVVGTNDIELSPAEQADLSAAEQEIIAENSALKAVIQLRDATIDDLERQLIALNIANEELQKELEIATIRLETTNYMFKIAMESLGKSSSHN